MPEVRSNPTDRNPAKDIHPTDYPDPLGDFLAAKFPNLRDVGQGSDPIPQRDRSWKEFPA